MDKLTKEQERKFWERYGFTKVHYNPLGAIGQKRSGWLDGQWHYLDIDCIEGLGRLFKHAVLPLISKNIAAYWKVLSIWYETLIKHNEDPAPALFRALDKIASDGEAK